MIPTITANSLLYNKESKLFTLLLKKLLKFQKVEFS
jgi:hypothetical protein